MTHERRRLLVLGRRADDPDGTALRAMITTVLTAAEDDRLAPAGYCDMVVKPPLDDKRGDAVRQVRTSGQRPRVHLDHDGPFVLTQTQLTAAIVDALRRQVAGPDETEAELDVLGALVAASDAGARQLVACSATPWQQPLITGETPLTLATALSSANRVPDGQAGVIIDTAEETSPVDPEHAPWMADVVHASLDGGQLKLSPLRVEGPRDGFVFPKNIVACHRTAALPGPMETLRILSALRRAADPSAGS